MDRSKTEVSLSSSQILNWLGLIKCTSRTWRDLLINTPINSCNIEEYPINKELSAMTSKIAYQNLLKGELQRENKLISYERAFKMLENDMYIAGIGQAVLELLSFKVGSGNLQRGISKGESPYFRNFRKSSVI